MDTNINEGEIANCDIHIHEGLEFEINIICPGPKMIKDAKRIGSMRKNFISKWNF